MAETLLSPTGILLYGRVLLDLTYNFVAPSEDTPPEEPKEGTSNGEPPRLGDTKFLQRQLAADNARFARIYGFSYEGHYYDLARPALFLVHGSGVRADTIVSGAPRAARAPDVADKFGVAATAKSFPSDMRVWAYDKGDFSVRMDVHTGSLEQILLEVELSSDVLKTFFGGASARLRTPQGGGSD